MQDVVLGYLAFCGIKLAGYTGAALLISRVYGRSDRNAILVGIVRTLIGMAAGAVLISASWAVDGLDV